MAKSKSSRLFQERAGLRPTRRKPVPVFDGERHPVHTLPLPCPLPAPGLVSNGDPAPDRGTTLEPWPHGTRCAEGAEPDTE
jgi:hypothetical protein